MLQYGLPSFGHKPLAKIIGNIRLLEVIRSTAGVIRCEMHEVALSSKPKYVALLYTWDRDGRYAHIECNKMPMRVGRNLWDFLNRYQHCNLDEHQGDLIWIDAVCINQENVQERNHQVDQMREVYSSAASVIVWLGEDEADVGPAFRALYRSARLGFQQDEDLDAFTSEAEGRSLIKLFQRPYWKGVWTVQEFVLAQEIEMLCGHLVLDFMSSRSLKAILQLEETL